MATISVTTAPASGVEWKTFNATVSITKGPFDIWTGGTISIYLKYAGVTVYTGTHIHTGSVSFIYEFGNAVDMNPLTASYPYSGATVEATFTPNAGGPVNTVAPQRTINITAATAVFSGGPFSRAVKEGCRWTEELVTVTMQDSGSTITGFGDGYTYNLSSSDGISFKDAVGGSAITSITFTGGAATLAICMNDEKAAAVFTITNATEASNTYTSDAFAVVNPSFTFANIADGSNEATAYDTRNNTSITASNSVDAGVSFSSFPDTSWSVSSLPAGAVNVTGVTFNTSGSASGINLAYQGVESGVILELSGNSCSADSDAFDIIPPAFVFTGAGFSRAVPRFFGGEISSVTMTARNKSSATVTALPGSNWSLDVVYPDAASHNLLSGLTFTSGVSSPSVTFPADDPGSYNFIVSRSGESDLTGSASLPIALPVALNSPSVSGDTATISGTASSDSAHSINVSIELFVLNAAIWISSGSVNVLTASAGGAFTHNFTGLANGTYKAVVKEVDDPGTSTEDETTQFIINIAAPVLDVILDDNGTATDIDALSATDAAPVAVNATRSLTITITTGDPTPAVPAATLTKPDGTVVNLNFAGTLSVTRTNANDLDINGVYTLTVSDYIDSTGTGAGFTRRFVIAQLALADQKTRELEGWGYYPREEGSPLNASESALGLSWVENGAGAATAAYGSAFLLSANNAVKDYKRSYNYIFNDDGASDVTGSASAYIEAGVSAELGVNGALLSAFDQSGSSFSYYSTGAGLILRTGAYLAKILLVEVTTGSYTGKRIALKIYNAVQDAFILSGVLVDWNDPLVIRIEKNGSAGIISIKVKSPGSTSAFTNILNAPIYRLPHHTTTAAEPFAGSVAGFGIFDANGQTVNTEWEFVRYAFYDSGFTIGAGDTYQLGFKTTQIHDAADAVIEPAFYRSQKILINAHSSDTEYQPAPGANAVTGVIYKNISAKYSTKDIPVKVRFTLADWNDSAEDSVTGFAKAGFKDYYEVYTEDGSDFIPYKPLNNVAGQTIAFKHLAADGSEKTPASSVNWDFTLDNTRLKRRMMIVGVVDAPLLDTPLVVKGGAIGDALIEDGAGKTDFRCAVRQFLPDFYIRDNETDDGFTAAGGSSSPDIVSGIFAGNGADFNPNDVPSDGLAATTPKYPAGFARGEAAVAVAGEDYKLYKDQKGGDLKVMNGSAWADVDAVNDFFNRVWVRLSNRGIVPGPARLQVFYGDSTTRSDFVPSLAQDENWEKIYGKDPTAAAGDEVFYQDRFMFFDAPNGASQYAIHPVSAIPALSGYSTPGAVKSYTLADFKWYIPEMPPDAKKHGCLTGYINHPDCTSGIDNARRWDGGALQGTADPSDTNVSVWGITTDANNVTVKNYNIVPSEAGEPDFNEQLKSKIDKDDTPVNYKDSPVNYRFTSVDKPSVIGLRLDGASFKGGELILRLPKEMSEKVNLKNFIEIVDYDDIDKIELYAGKASIVSAAAVNVKDKLKAKAYKFFQLKRGSVGEIRNLTLKVTDNRAKLMKSNSVNMFFRPDGKIKKGEYEVKIEELINGKITGGYITTIKIIDKEKIKYVYDAKTKAVYRFDKALVEAKAVKFADRTPLTGAGLAAYNYKTLSPYERMKLTKPEMENELANFDKAFKMTKKPFKHNYNYNYSLTGRIITGSKGDPLPGLIVKLCDLDGVKDDFIRACMTGNDGYYTINFTEKELAKGFSKKESADAALIISDADNKILEQVKVQLKTGMTSVEEIKIKSLKEIKGKALSLKGIVVSKSKNYKDVFIKAFMENKDFIGESWLTQNDEFSIELDEKFFIVKEGTEDKKDRFVDIVFQVLRRINKKYILIGKTTVRHSPDNKFEYSIIID